MPDDQLLDGKVCLVTGATSGLGKTQLFHGQKTIPASVYAQDEQVQEHLWVESARLVNLKETL